MPLRNNFSLSLHTFDKPSGWCSNPISYPDTACGIRLFRGWKNNKNNNTYSVSFDHDPDRENIWNYVDLLSKRFSCEFTTDMFGQ